MVLAVEGFSGEVNDKVSSAVFVAK